MTSVLLVHGADPQAPDLSADLRAAGIHVLGAVACDKLVQEAVRHGPDLLVVWAVPADDALFRALAMLRDTQPLPVLAFAQDPGVEALQRALEADVHAWVVQGYAPQRLRPLVQLALARFKRERAQREAMEELTQRFEERKVVDRAKGILMFARRIPEDDAFRLLRDAAMHSKQRVGQVAQQLVDAAQQAARVNRAGQLRMLSQRLVKLYALAVSGDAAATAELRATSAQVDDRIERLGQTLSRPTFGDLLDATLQSWSGLHVALGKAPERARLGEVDAAAEQLLESAERLTHALEVASPLAALEVVNRAGRQRMLSQRLAKQALLAALGDAPLADRAAAAAVETIAAFEATLRHLDAAPLGTPAQRSSLAAAAAEWQRMLAGVRDAADAPGRQTLAAASDALLARFEQLTVEYGRMAQQLFGPT